MNTENNNKAGTVFTIEELRKLYSDCPDRDTLVDRLFEMFPDRKIFRQYDIDRYTGDVTWDGYFFTQKEAENRIESYLPKAPLGDKERIEIIKISELLKKFPNKKERIQIMLYNSIYNLVGQKIDKEKREAEERLKASQCNDHRRYIYTEKGGMTLSRVEFRARVKVVESKKDEHGLWYLLEVVDVISDEGGCGFKPGKVFSASRQYDYGLFSLYPDYSTFRDADFDEDEKLLDVDAKEEMPEKITFQNEIQIKIEKSKQWVDNLIIDGLYLFVNDYLEFEEKDTFKAIVKVLKAGTDNYGIQVNLKIIKILQNGENKLKEGDGFSITASHEEGIPWTFIEQ